jgi:cyanophycinase
LLKVGEILSTMRKLIRTLLSLLIIVTPITANVGRESTTVAQAKEPGAWWPASGAVILAGGGLQNDTADNFIDRLIALAGGPEAPIVIIPTAWDGLPAELPGDGPEPARIAPLRKHLESRGARHVAFLHTRDRQVANSEVFVKILQSAKGVFFTGGASRVLDETYHGTLVERELKALLKRGGVVAGDSAGAITIGCFWLGWSSPTSGLGKITDGLCLLPSVTVSPHAQRMGGEWTDEISKYVSAHPPVVGINIDEDTALVLKSSTAEVLGKKGVTFFNAGGKSARGLLRLAAGERHDFAK